MFDTHHLKWCSYFIFTAELEYIHSPNLFLYGCKSTIRISLTSLSISCNCFTMCCPKKPLPPANYHYLVINFHLHQYCHCQLVLINLINETKCIPVISTTSPLLSILFISFKCMKKKNKIYLDY